jgi:hypothetical protein
VDSEAAESAAVSEPALEGILLGRVEHGRLGCGAPFSFLDAKMVLQMRRALLVTGRADVEDEVVTAAPAHTGEQGPASALGVVRGVITLRRQGDEVVVRAAVGMGREDAQGRALGWQFAR